MFLRLLLVKIGFYISYKIVLGTVLLRKRISIYKEYKTKCLLMVYRLLQRWLYVLPLLVES